LSALSPAPVREGNEWEQAHLKRSRRFWGEPCVPDHAFCPGPKKEKKNLPSRTPSPGAGKGNYLNLAAAKTASYSPVAPGQSDCRSPRTGLQSPDDPSASSHRLLRFDGAKQVNRVGPPPARGSNPGERHLGNPPDRSLLASFRSSAPRDQAASAPSIVACRVRS